MMEPISIPIPEAGMLLIAITVGCMVIMIRKHRATPGTLLTNVATMVNGFAYTNVLGFGRGLTVIAMILALAGAVLITIKRRSFDENRSPYRR